LLEEELLRPWRQFLGSPSGEIDAAIEAAADRASEIQQRSLKPLVDGLAALSSRTRSGATGGRLAQACPRLPWRCPFGSSPRRPKRISQWG